jgi:hypothetical protein
MLRSRKSRREEPSDVHVPDPIVSRADAIDPAHEAPLDDSVGLALLVVLETLDPAERLAFVLHDMFAVPFDEIAPIWCCKCALRSSMSAWERPFVTGIQTSRKNLKTRSSRLKHPVFYALLRRSLREASEDAAPPHFGIKGRFHGLGLGSVAFEAAVFQLDSRCAWTFGDKPNLDFRAQLGVVLPICADIPGQHNSVRGLPDQHPTPIAFSAIAGTLEPASSRLWLNDCDLCRSGTDMVGFQWPPSAMLLGEHRESMCLRGVYQHRLAHGCFDSVFVWSCHICFSFR